MGQAARLSAALVVLTAAAPAAAADFTLAVEHGGLTRTALVHAPAGAGAARAVVINVHGGGGNVNSHRRWTRMLTGAGHVWPGASSFLPKLLGPPTTVLDANEELWKFFERFRLR